MTVPEPDPRSDDASTEAYLQSVEELLGLLLEETPFGELLEQVLDLTARAVTNADGVAVTVHRSSGRHDTAAASSEAVRLLDEVQRAAGSGPCVDALEAGEERYVPDLRSDERWDERVREAAERTGLVAVMAVPLRAAGATIGALNVFSRTVDGIDREAAATVRGIAAPVAGTLANARAYHRAAQLGDQLREALTSRAVIEQAKGILMVRANVDAEEAFALLRRTSQHQNRKLRDVAAAVVSMREQLPPPTEPDPG